VGFILVLWVNRFALNNDDRREIPLDMQSFLESPPRPLPDLNLNTGEKLALTTGWFKGKWSFVYFTYGHCLPACRASLDKMKAIQKALANSDVQFLMIGLDTKHETAENLVHFLRSQAYSFTVGATREKGIEELAKVFRALFLQTDFTDGRYIIEQEQAIFVVDPKGRVYATFRSPYNNMLTSFFTLRRFYAQTE
jgi:cytochrome oxidase Cu insertion factor (SCO1/SenC/PrrC family)